MKHFPMVLPLVERVECNVLLMSCNTARSTVYYGPSPVLEGLVSYSRHGTPKARLLQKWKPRKLDTKAVRHIVDNTRLPHQTTSPEKAPKLKKNSSTLSNRFPTEKSRRNTLLRFDKRKSDHRREQIHPQC